MTTREHKEKTIVGPLIGVILVITIIAAFAVVILRQTAAQGTKGGAERPGGAAGRAGAAASSGSDALTAAGGCGGGGVQLPVPVGHEGGDGRAGARVSDRAVRPYRAGGAGAVRRGAAAATAAKPSTRRRLTSSRFATRSTRWCRTRRSWGWTPCLSRWKTAYGTLWESPGVMTSFDAAGLSVRQRTPGGAVAVRRP